MTIADSLQGVSRLFLDSATVIYFVERNPQYFDLARAFFERINEGTLIGVASPVTLAECLVRPYSLGQIEFQRYFIDLLTNSANIEFVPIASQYLAIQAEQIRARYNLQLPDAFQIAVALAANCEAFLTNDVILRRVTELRVLVLDELDVA
ncbi:type II toxin-antitoxin system VapC family toxin [Microseira wollei]|uniref:PilT protein domain protein n=1 Tax=Microseira wollei NIES-4236 TaxID=2530354 RepID=A0AAV3XKR5_9CYAN|nr:PIN domain-containing protein [Microseira wollei]GET43069.1 PilT protein domain protein [Microseira wollei NIES-4236]